MQWLQSWLRQTQHEDVDHDQLRQLLALRRHGSFVRAAEHCHVSPSTLTRTVQRMEREVGASLVDRRPDGVAFTDAGQLVADHAEEVLAGWERLQRQLGGAGAVTGHLRVHCTVTAAQSIVPDLLRAFRRDHPEVGVELSTGDAAGALARVLDEEVDAALAALPTRLPRGVDGLELHRTPLRVIAAADRASPVDWAAEPIVVPATGLVRDEVLAWFRRARRSPEIAAETEGHEAVLPLVAVGMGVGVVPALVVEASALATGLRVLEAEPPLPDVRVGLCVLRRRRTEPALDALWSAAASVAPDAHRRGASWEAPRR